MSRPTCALGRSNARPRRGAHGAASAATTAKAPTAAARGAAIHKAAQLLFEGFNLFLKRKCTPKLIGC
jgi:hypothetical protein